MRNIEEVMADIDTRYDAYNDISKMMYDNGWDLKSNWDGNVSVGGSFRKGWQRIRVETYWDDDRIRLVINGEDVRDIDWDFLWEKNVLDIIEEFS